MHPKKPLLLHTAAYLLHIGQNAAYCFFHKKCLWMDKNTLFRIFCNKKWLLSKLPKKAPAATHCYIHTGKKCSIMILSLKIASNGLKRIFLGHFKKEMNNNFPKYPKKPLRLHNAVYSFLSSKMALNG